MQSFADREKGFEARFKLDEELRFKTTARRNNMLGLWAAGLLGLEGAAAADYAKGVVDAQFRPGGDKNVVDKVAADLGVRDVTITPSRVRFELEHFAEQAKRQLMRE